MSKKRYVAVLPKQFDGGCKIEVDDDKELIQSLRNNKYRRHFIIRDRMTGEPWGNPYNKKRRNPAPDAIDHVFTSHRATDAELASFIGENPEEEKDETGVVIKGASWTGSISWRGITFKAKIFKLHPVSLYEKEKIIERDIMTGKLAMTMQVDAITHQPVNYKRPWVIKNDDGTIQEISKDRIQHLTVIDGREMPVAKYPKTDPIVCEWELLPSEANELIIVEDGTYEVVPVSQDDVFGMYKMFEEIRKLGKYPAGEFVRAAGWKKVGMFFEPRNDSDGNFALIAKAVGTKISPTQFHPVPKGEPPVPKAVAPTLKGKPIFGKK